MRQLVLVLGLVFIVMKTDAYGENRYGQGINMFCSTKGWKAVEDWFGYAKNRYKSVTIEIPEVDWKKVDVKDALKIIRLTKDEYNNILRSMKKIQSNLEGIALKQDEIRKLKELEHNITALRIRYAKKLNDLNITDGDDALVGEILRGELSIDIMYKLNGKAVMEKYVEDHINIINKITAGNREQLMRVLETAEMDIKGLVDYGAGIDKDFRKSLVPYFLSGGGSLTVAMLNEAYADCMQYESKKAAKKTVHPYKPENYRGCNGTVCSPPEKQNTSYDIKYNINSLQGESQNTNYDIRYDAVQK